MQQMTVNLTIPIPTDSVLITRVEYEQLKELQLEGVYWTMRDLEKRFNKKKEWIKDHILYKSQFRKKLDSRLNGFVYYPQGKGEVWSFQAKKMAKFLEDNFKDIFK
ncbi:DUF771 domain-containing protein [Peribacillus sp. NPDC097295]|uniref:DUF771 domain-containing protein n=1 Tax=Peribacillus sp. NPDC097295 TaxID=3364402 RepID=UPI0037F25EF1